jgi:uncharacterized protein involved in propanediol utilization
MALTIARRSHERRLHPRAEQALSTLLRSHGYASDEADLIAATVSACTWTTLPSGDRSLRDDLDAAGLRAFLALDLD